MTWNPMNLLETEKHLTILGGTRSGKTNFAIYYARAKLQQNRRVLFVTAKPEAAYRSMFDERFVNDVDKALESMIKQPKKSVLLELDIEQADEAGRLLNGIGEWLRMKMEKGEDSKVTVFVDEISLLVKNKADTSDTNVALTRAAATWSAYGGQLVSVAQRSAMIHHTVLTQGDLVLFRVPKGDLKSLSMIAYPDMKDEEITTYLDNYQYHSIYVDGFDLRYMKPVALQEKNRSKDGIPDDSPP